MTLGCGFRLLPLQFAWSLVSGFHLLASGFKSVINTVALKAMTMITMMSMEDLEAKTVQPEDDHHSCPLYTSNNYLC